ncbi:MAG: IclR family transcriptional regulator [Dysosmobacter sp.]
MKTSANEAAPKNLDRALDLLNLLATNSNPMNVMEISKALDVTRTTAYAMLGSLSKKKLVEKDAETGRYSIGYKVLELAECYYHRYPLPVSGREIHRGPGPEVVAKGQRSPFSREPAIFLLLASKDPSFLVPRMVIGHIMPAYATASGKVLLSALSEEKLEEVLDSIQLVSYTAKTIVDREELKECLREARKNGFATEGRRVDGPAQLRGRAHSGSLRRLHRRHQLLRQHRNHRCQHAGLNQ